MSIDGIDSRTGEAYDNMVLVSNAVGYTQTGEYVVTFVYETLTATWTKEQEDTVSSTDNGLRIVERSEVATIAATAPYDEDNIGWLSITSGGKTLYLAGFKDETKAEADTQIGRVTTQWLEAGTLSETLDNVGSQKAKVIEAIGPDPATPSGYSLASKQESSFNGFQTNRFTFLKDCILRVDTPKVGGSQRVSVQAFDMTEAEVTADLAAVTASHELIDIQESDYEGIKTSTFVFEVNDFEVRSQTENGLQLLTRTELSITNFTDGDVGTDTYSGLYLAGEEIDNGNTIKKRITSWSEAGVLSEVISDGPSNLPRTRTRSVRAIAEEPTGTGILISKSQQNKDGIITYDYTFLENLSGGSPVGLLQSYETIIEVRKPGVVSGSVINFVAEIIQTPPTVGKIKATVSVTLTTSSTATLPVAYNLDGVSCSATITETRITPIGIEQGNSLSVAVYNTRRSSQVRPFPNHYHGSDASTSYTTPASIIRDNDNIIGESLNETHSSQVTFSGTSSAPATTGIYEEIVEPVFVSSDGTQYFRKTTYTI
jgi:hypothetical protein